MDYDSLLSKSTLLIVDDTPLDLQILFSYLKQIKCKVHIATSGKQAIALSKVTHLDLILLDVMMPELNGFQTCHLLKKDPDTQDIPIIFMTALSDIKQKLKGFKIGAVDYITKPIQNEEVIARIRTHLQLGYQQKQLTLQNDALIENSVYLQQQNKEFDAITQTIIQNLRLPLVVLSGFTKMLQTEINKLPDPKQPSQYLQEIEQTRTHMVSKIDNILLLTGVSRNETMMEELNMALLIEAAREKVSYLFQKYLGTFNMSTDIYPSVFGQEYWIERVWIAYMEYGLNHGGRPAEISIYTEILPDIQMVKFNMKYNGLPLTDIQKNNLFISFTDRVNNEQSDLGLSAVHRIIEKCHGQVGAEYAYSKEKGSNILYFTLPMAIF